MENVKDTKELDLELNDIKYVDLALQLSDYEDKDIQRICNSLDDDSLAKVLEESEVKVQKKIISFISNQRAMEVFSYMSKDDIVDILGELNTGRRKELMLAMKQGDVNEIKQLLGYKDDSAGGIMTTEYIALYKRLTISQAIKVIKEITPKTEYIDTIYVMNNNKKIVGTADLRNILVADENLTMEDIETVEGDILVAIAVKINNKVRLIDNFLMTV